MGIIYWNNEDSNPEIIVSSKAQIKFAKLVFTSNVYKKISLIKFDGEIMISHQIGLTQTHINLSLSSLEFGNYNIFLEAKKPQKTKRLILKYTA